MKVVVSLGSQVHQMPHTGRARSGPCNQPDCAANRANRARRYSQIVPSFVASGKEGDIGNECGGEDLILLAEASGVLAV
jgi:hypothetical protein